jgi:hypothetical protein
MFFSFVPKTRPLSKIEQEILEDENRQKREARPNTETEIEGRRLCGLENLGA